MTTVIGVAGSPRKNGNSATLMRAVLRGAALAGADTRELYLNGLVLQGCQGCLKCSSNRRCILNDQLTTALEELRKADGWVLASPIYYDCVSGQMKTFFDRCRTFTKDPRSQELRPQLEGTRRAVVVVSYEDAPREDYLREAHKLVSYLAWMGDFGEVGVICEGNLGPPDAAANRPDLLARAQTMGREVFSGL